MNSRKILRGDVFYANLGNDGVGSEQNGRRPVAIVSNDLCNKFSPTITVVVVTSKVAKKKLPTQVLIEKDEYGFLLSDSMVTCEQTRTIDKSRLSTYLGRLNEETMEEVDRAIEIQNGLKKIETKEIKFATAKADRVRGLDSFIEMWVEKGRDISEIMDFMSEREAKIKELERYCNGCGLDYREYYKPQVKNNCIEVNKFKKMVG